MITVYAIKHIPSGEYMPQRMSRTGFAGWSWWREPNVTPFDTTPRLFPTKQGAANALSAWLQGRWVTIAERYGGFEEPEYEDRYPAPEKPKHARNRDEMKIVPMELREAQS